MAQVKTDELDQLHDYGVYTPARLIDCIGDIDEDKAKEFIKNIRLLDHTNHKDITVLIGTDGGSVHWGMAIFDAIKECNSKVITHAIGPCWSMGACILQAGDERRISANATVMLHEGQMKLDEDHPKNIERWYKEFKRIGQVYDEIILKKIKEKKPRFRKDRLNDIMVFDTIYTAEKVIEMGLADKIQEHKSF